MLRTSRPIAAGGKINVPGEPFVIYKAAEHGMRFTICALPSPSFLPLRLHRHLLTMDFLKKAASVASEINTNLGAESNNNNSSTSSNGNTNNNAINQNQNQNSTSGSNNGLDGVAGVLVDKVNSALGGGSQGEKKEDILDKAIDVFQERVLTAGDQSNESAAEQAKDKIIADTIRTGYKSLTGKDIPV
ncbi:hypothetical protein D9613_012238 [Agrocybe pediades]|uniref:Uncharacterized protein n=1 Tax=Agrocybe pediades TaxID=84607 RepID=A0A8H4QEQ7_9AGAR|nr:hypothetical protein D9613_012238 [Agrocybe pediades]